MNIREFEYVVEIATQESISKAAARLYLSQPTLTKFLKKIESEFETPLFYRLGKKMIPTPAGAACVEKAKNILEINDRLNKSVAAARQANHDHIRIGTSASRGDFFVAKIIPEMTRIHPNLCFILTLGAKSDLMEKLENNELDIVFVSNSSERPYLNYFNIAKEEMVLVVPDHHHLLTASMPRVNFHYPYVALEEWSSYPFIMADIRMTTGQYERMLFNHYHIKPHTTLEVGSLPLIYAAVRQNIGITIAPSMPLIRSEHTNLHYLSFDDDSNIEWYFTAIVKEPFVLSDKIAELIELVTDEYTQCFTFEN